MRAVTADRLRKHARLDTAHSPARISDQVYAAAIWHLVTQQTMFASVHASFSGIDEEGRAAEPSFLIMSGTQVDLAMSESTILKIQEIVSAGHQNLRERLSMAGPAIEHALVAVTPDGAAIVRSNVGSAELSEMAELLAEVADETPLERPENDPVN